MTPFGGTFHSSREKRSNSALYDGYKRTADEIERWEGVGGEPATYHIIAVINEEGCLDGTRGSEYYTAFCFSTQVYLSFSKM